VRRYLHGRRHQWSRKQERGGQNERMERTGDDAIGKGRKKEKGGKISGK